MRVSPSQYGGYDPRLVTEWVRVRIPSIIPISDENSIKTQLRLFVNHIKDFGISSRNSVNQIKVSMALFSYNAVFKTFFKTPLSRLQWCLFFAGLYIMSSFSTLYCAYVYGWVESYDCDMVCYVLTWMFSRYPDQRDIMILLLWNHIIPASLNFFLISKVRKELVRRNELDLFDPQKTYSLCLGDRKLIALSKFLCIYYAIASSPLILRETVKWITESKAMDAYMPNCFEALPFYFILLESFFFFKFELNEFETVWDEFKIDTRQRLKAIKPS
ncbi:uncharacterized protein TNCV_2280121 [Trichonephila clavipes]|nr:uncharacterized protein TNCV_2280121 [Trichonephila clavipes]